jgi:alpha-mannosidase
LTIAPELTLYEDLSDTWSHGLARFDGQELERAIWDAPVVADEGPLLAALVQRGRLGKSHLTAEWRVYAGGEALELVLDVDWRASRRLLKLELTPPEPVVGRLDGVLGGPLDRGVEARERPLQDFTLMRLKSGRTLGVVCPDVFGIDAVDDRVRLTLLRSPFMAHHDPIDPETFVRRTVADQGSHRFRFQFLAGDSLRPSDLAERALMLQRAPLIAESTKGMMARSTW